MRTTSAAGIALITGFEGLELESYQDIAGIWTVGYGHTGPEVTPDMKITFREAEMLLKNDLRPRENAINETVTVPLNQNQFDALVSFIYNIGIAGWKSSTALKRLNKGDYAGAAKAMLWWNKATVDGKLTEVRGLTRRREGEKGLFESPPAQANTAVGAAVHGVMEEAAKAEELATYRRTLSYYTPIEVQPLLERVLEKLTAIGK